MEKMLERLAGMLSLKPTEFEHGNFMTTHKDVNVIELERFAENPKRIRENKEFSTVDAFIEYVKDYVGEDTKIFSDANYKTITAVFDYHGKDSPSWATHTATISFATDPDWNAWKNTSDHSLNQRSLVNFFLDYADDFLTPDKAEVMEIVGMIKAVKTTNADSEAKGLTANEVVRRSLNIKSSKGDIPELFTVKVPVLKGFDKYALDFRLGIKFDEDDGSIMFLIKLVRPHLIEDSAFNDAACMIQEMIGINVYGANEDKSSKVE